MLGIQLAVHWDMVKIELTEVLGFTFPQKRYKSHEIGAESEICTCSYTVEWQDGPLKGKRKTLSCGQLCLLSTKNVETHPLIIDLLRHASRDVLGSLVEQQEEEDSRPNGTNQRPVQTRSRKRATVN
jgi:hypothetical protein